ncbi:MAG: hypothetical protein GY928_05510 [Colwellia sp.]|nr:hypothetical protein [Colwellia sp.]
MDHFIITINDQLSLNHLLLAFINHSIIYLYSYYYFNSNFLTSKLFINNNYLIIPLYAVIKILLLSYDVIHSIGYYSLGIKIDAIPGRINITQSIRPLLKGEYRGFCYELCGQGHASMLLTMISI